MMTSTDEKLYTKLYNYVKYDLNGYVFTDIIHYAIKHRKMRQDLLTTEFKDLVHQYMLNHLHGGVLLKASLAKLAPYYTHLVALPDYLRCDILNELFTGDFDEQLNIQINAGIKSPINLPGTNSLPMRRYIDAACPFTEIWIECREEEGGVDLLVYPQFNAALKYHANYEAFVKRVSERYSLWWLNHPNGDKDQAEDAYTFRAVTNITTHSVSWRIVRSNNVDRSVFTFQTSIQAAYHGARLAHILWEESVNSFEIHLRKAQVKSPEHHHIALVEVAF